MDDDNLTASSANTLNTLSTAGASTAPPPDCNECPRRGSIPQRAADGVFRCKRGHAWKICRHCNTSKSLQCGFNDCGCDGEFEPGINLLPVHSVAHSDDEKEADCEKQPAEKQDVPDGNPDLACGQSAQGSGSLCGSMPAQWADVGLPHLDHKVGREPLPANSRAPLRESQYFSVQLERNLENGEKFGIAYATKPLSVDAQEYTRHFYGRAATNGLFVGAVKDGGACIKYNEQMRRFPGPLSERQIEQDDAIISVNGILDETDHMKQTLMTAANVHLLIMRRAQDPQAHPAAAA